MSQRKQQSARSPLRSPPVIFSDPDNDAIIVDDLDGFERVGGAGGKKRRKSNAANGAAASSSASSAAKERKKRKTAESAHINIDGEIEDDDDEAAAAAPASALASQIAQRARTDATTKEQPMSRVARAATSAQLNYFDQLTAPAKSRNTMADVPKLTSEQRANIAATLPKTHTTAKQRLVAYHTSRMREWYLHLRSGYNLLCYGIGSKKSLLADFAQTWLTDGPIVVMNGYFSGSNVKNLLNILTRDLMLLPTQTFRDLHAHVDFVRDWFAKDARMAKQGGRRGRVVEEEEKKEDGESEEDEDGELPSMEGSTSAFLPHVYIVLHNIDGASLRTDVQQQVLSQLAAIPQIHLIASVDHVLSAWLWDQSALNAFNWVHHDCTTYAEYKHEFLNASLMNDVLPGASSAATQAARALGIANVLTSLTPNHRKVLDLIAHEQLTENNPHFITGTTYLLFSAILEECESNMLVSNASSFERLLGEMKDHSLIEEKTVQSKRAITIPYSERIIRRHILGEKEEDETKTGENGMLAQAAEEAEAELERQRIQARKEANPFQTALGGVDDDEEEEGEEANEELESESDEE